MQQNLTTSNLNTRRQDLKELANGASALTALYIGSATPSGALPSSTSSGAEASIKSFSVEENVR
jgi:hypothetical protein